MGSSVPFGKPTEGLRPASGDADVRQWVVHAWPDTIADTIRAAMMPGVMVRRNRDLILFRPIFDIVCSPQDCIVRYSLFQIDDKFIIMKHACKT